MCLFPGMLENGPSYPSPRAMKLASVLKFVAMGLAVASLAQGVVYPGGGQAFANAIFVLYSYFVLRSFWQKPVPLIFVENILCFAMLSLINGALSALRLATDLQADSTSLGKHDGSSSGKKGDADTVDLDARGIFPLHDLPRNQMFACVALSCTAIFCYVLLASLALVVARDLRTTIVEAAFSQGMFGGGPFGTAAPSETLPFSRSATSRQSNFGTYSAAPPVGTYAPVQDDTRSMPSQNDARFPGRGYKLNS